MKKTKIFIFFFLLINLFVFDSHVFARPVEGTDGTGSAGGNTSKGYCCVYKSSDGTPLYFYNSAYVNESKSNYYRCIGTNCIDSHTSATAAQMSGSWSEYVNNISNCKNMPVSIWHIEEKMFDLFGKELASWDSYADYTADDVKDLKSVYPNLYTSTRYELSSSETCPGDILVEDNTDNNSGNNSNSDSNGNINWGELADENCDGLIGQEMLDFINKIFRWIQIIAPIFVIIMGSVELAGAVLQDDKDALKKATSKFTKRLIIAVALFFIPVLLSFILQIFNDVTGKNADFCEIGVKENE